MELKSELEVDGTIIAILLFIRLLNNNIGEVDYDDDNYY